MTTSEDDLEAQSKAIQNDLEAKGVDVKRTSRLRIQYFGAVVEDIVLAYQFQCDDCKTIGDGEVSLRDLVGRKGPGSRPLDRIDITINTQGMITAILFEKNSMVERMIISPNSYAYIRVVDRAREAIDDSQNH